MPGMRAEMLRRAKLIESTAIAISPIGDDDPHASHYKSSWETDSTSRGGRNRDRAAATVSNTSYYARWVEYGNGRPSGPAHHVLLRAAQMGGRNQ
ncbi:HK97 gp10 family phage protein [Streptomyces kaempferi]